MQLDINSGASFARSTGVAIIGPYNRSLMDSLFPSITTIQRIALSLVMVAVLVGAGKASFYLPDNPVPITLQTSGVLLMGGFLGLRWGLAAILVYYFLGMAGVPVFKGNSAGFEFVTSSVTAGYILGFLTAVPIVGFLSEHGWTRGKNLWPMMLGNLWIYVPALIWLSIFDFGWPADGELFKGAMYQFIPGDLVKLILASMVIGLGWRIADRRNENRS